MGAPSFCPAASCTLSSAAVTKDVETDMKLSRVRQITAWQKKGVFKPGNQRVK